MCRMMNFKSTVRARYSEPGLIGTDFLIIALAVHNFHLNLNR